MHSITESHDFVMNARREEQPGQKSHFLPGAMRNPERVSYKAERKRSHNV